MNLHLTKKFQQESSIIEGMELKKSTKKFAILIPTRNRPKELSILLDSITKSHHLPSQVVIVAAGQDVRDVVNDFKELLNIDYCHTETRGQIAQKRIGVALVLPEIEWCLFLDDDLALAHDCMAIAFDALNHPAKGEIIGIGLALPPSSRGLNLPWGQESILRLFKLYSSEPGRVLSSGHATSYLQERQVVETQWLNGASLWRTSIARNYGKDLPSTPYAACEDLVFSYPHSKKGVLIYAPEAKVYFQSNELTQFDSFEVLKSASYWRFFLVAKSSDLSFKWFFLSQVVRLLYAVKIAKQSRFRLLFGLLKINFKLLGFYFLSKSPESLLNELHE
jgi:glycosyltransferase involved in cell wall biosynthesis